MFKFDFLADDKNVVRILRAVTGLTYNLNVVEAVNATKKKGKGNGAVAPLTDGSLLSMVRKQIIDSNKTELTNDDLVEMIKKAGRSSTSSYYASKGLIKDKVLKRVEPGVFKVLAAKGE